VLNGEISGEPLTNAGHSCKGKKPHIYSPKNRAEIGKRYTADLRLCTGRKNQKKRLRGESGDVTKCLWRKEGDPLLLGKRLDDQVQQLHPEAP